MHTNIQYTDRQCNVLLFQRMSALQELQLLEIMCSCFQEQSRDTVRQLMFSALFSLQGNQADESRMGLLGKLVSMAIAVGRVPILECAATWLQVSILTQVHTCTELCIQSIKCVLVCDLIPLLKHFHLLNRF